MCCSMGIVGVMLFNNREKYVQQICVLPDIQLEVRTSFGKTIT